MMRVRSRRIGWAVGLGLIVVVGFLVWQVAGDDGDNGGLLGDEVLIGTSRVEVDRLIGDDVYLAVEGPAPEIETSGLGVEQPIDRTPVPAPKRFGRPVVLVGSNRAVDAAGFGDSSLFYYTQYADLWNRFLALFGGGERALECFGSQTGSVCVGGGALLGGRPSAASEVADDSTVPVVVQWMPLPPETSLVVVRDVNGNPLWWQRPAGRLAYLAIAMDIGATVELEALDSQGRRLAGESFTRCDFRDPNRPPQC